MTKKRTGPADSEPLSDAAAQEPAGATEVPEAPQTAGTPPPLKGEGRVGVIAGAAAEAEARITELEQHAAQSQDAMLRAIADLQTFRRRAMQEAAQARRAGAEEIAARFLPVLDNLERTLEAATGGASLEAVVEGVKLTERQCRAALEASRVMPIHALGLKFDPKLHEAVASVESDHEEGTIIEELERGYLIGDRVLRPTRAKVSKGRAK